MRRAAASIPAATTSHQQPGWVVPRARSENRAKTERDQRTRARDGICPAWCTIISFTHGYFYLNVILFAHSQERRALRIEPGAQPATQAVQSILSAHPQHIPTSPQQAGSKKKTNKKNPKSPRCKGAGAGRWVSSEGGGLSRDTGCGAGKGESRWPRKDQGGCEGVQGRWGFPAILIAARIFQSS